MKTPLQNHKPAYYEKSSRDSILEYAKKAISMTFREIIMEDRYDYLIENPNDHPARKGQLGEIIEKYYFGYEPNNTAAPDFEEAEMELKVSPYRINRNQTLSVKERLVISMIDYMRIAEEPFDRSSLLKKIKHILLIYYRYLEEAADRLDYSIDYVLLFEPLAEDGPTIRKDYDIIREKVLAGEAHLLSSADTSYLEAVTKAADSTKTRQQPFSRIPAKPRAFAFKSSYMTFVLNKHMMGDASQIESIMKVSPNWNRPFEDYVLEKINAQAGRMVSDLCIEYGLNAAPLPKSIYALLAYRILGIKGNHAEEFVKSNIVVKSVRLNQKGFPAEHMSFPAFQFRNILRQEWHESDLYSLFSSTRFLFIIYQEAESDDVVLKGARFWNMPAADLDGAVKGVWEQTQAAGKYGVKFRKAGKRTFNNLPKASENRVCHVRPHARNKDDVDILPNGQTIPKQAFWLNSSYILSQLDETPMNKEAED